MTRDEAYEVVIGFVVIFFCFTAIFGWAWILAAANPVTP